MKKILAFSMVALVSGVALAAPNIPSQNYVDTVDANMRSYVDADKVSVAQTANQTMAGTYTVAETGSITVPTQPLPKSVVQEVAG